MNEPTTEAGRTLLLDVHGPDNRHGQWAHDIDASAILAIEQEAVAKYRQELPRALHERYAGALCISDLDLHDWAACDAKPQWEKDAAALLGEPNDD